MYTRVAKEIMKYPEIENRCKILNKITPHTKRAKGKIIVISAPSGSGKSSIISEIMKYPEIVEIYETTGNYDMVVKIRTRNSDDLNTFLDRVGEVEGVEATHTMVVLKVHKETTELPL